ncbi:type II secretion system protein GspL [Chitinimonas koreensis]|uniref:type II secretion system protein GspL n=1 Tax=Chitinimonas koreensis TaxID=356302 RepID=UPI000410E660|nr:type II secretion system protein GspL [Chitinimonas koreensis]QNM97744.1 hypothetical protein H9L41_05500 [Chitinimonas koreensis]
MSTLRIFPAESDLPLAGDQAVEWRLLDGLRVSRGRSPLAQLPAAARVELFLPPARVLRAVAPLPPGARKQARKLIPFALDQVLLAEPGEQHLAHRMVGEQCRVAAVDRAAFAETIQRLSQAGRRPRAAWTADALVAADGRTLLWCGHGWARRSEAAAQWFDAASPAEPPALLVAALGECESLLLAGVDADAVALERWQAVLGCPVEVAVGDPLAAPVAADAIDLMQGEFAAGPQFDFDWDRIKPSLALAAAALALAAVGWFGQWLSWRGEEARLKQSINAAYAAAFPGEPVVEPQLQLQGKLRNAASTGAVDAGTLAPVLKAATHLAVGGQIKLLSFEYAAGRVSAEYRGQPAELLGFSKSLAALGQVETSQTAPDQMRINLTLKP